MKEFLSDVTKITIIILLFLSSYVMRQYRIKVENQDEHIKILEQSLNEQIQEKQVYMNMLNEVE